VPGGSPHLAAQLFKVMAGIGISNVAYESVAALFDDLLTGKIQMMFPNAAAAKLHLKSGSLKALAVTSTGPSEQFPLLPTVESTVPGYASEAVFAILAPARTPAHTIRKLHAAIARLLRQPEVKQQVLTAGIEVVGSTPGQLAATIKLDIHRMAKVFGDIRGE
jgi:tripartite-type tricarboxylate transporter receptor subunit TctC